MSKQNFSVDVTNVSHHSYFYLYVHEEPYVTILACYVNWCFGILLPNQGRAK